jgi:hypothetical protein
MRRKIIAILLGAGFVLLVMSVRRAYTRTKRERTVHELEAPVADQDDPIKERLSLYPKLHRVLGEDWLEREVNVHPAKSQYALARWLRFVNGFEVRLEMLDRLLGMFEKTSGIAERCDRIRGDAPSLEATFTELHFAGWLAENGIRFEMPKEGADFRVELPEGSSLPIEAMTPRRDVWFDDLFTRLQYISRGSGISLRWGFYREDLPNYGDDVYRLEMQLDEETALSIVNEALANIAEIEANQGRGRTAFEQRRPEIGLRAEWWKEDHRYMSGSTGAGTPVAGDIWAQIRNAARIKAQKQLPEGQTSALLVGANQLNEGNLGYWADMVEKWPDEHVPINWNQIPSQIKYVILYKPHWGQLEPRCALLLVNEESPYPDVAGFEAFRKRMFPIRYRQLPTRFTAWASTDRCFDRSWF